MEIVKFKFPTLSCEEEKGKAPHPPPPLIVNPIPAKKNKGRKGEVRGTLSQIPLNDGHPPLDIYGATNGFASPSPVSGEGK